MQSRLYKAGWKMLDVLFPPSCAGCGSWGSRYCPTCFEKTQLLDKPICQICGDVLHDDHDPICGRCRSQQVAFSAIRSWAYFTEPIQSAIHKLKYRHDRGLGEVLAQPLIELYQNYLWKVDLIIPVPLDLSRQRERGYNQSTLLARPISWETGIPWSVRALKRVKTTKQQVGLTLNERAENVMGAFWADDHEINGKNILVVDDVVTTGATINACAHALIQAGANQVFGLTLTRSSHI